MNQKKEVKKESIIKEIKKNQYVKKEYQNYLKIISNYQESKKLNYSEYATEIYNIFESEINYKCFIVDDNILNDYEYNSLIESFKDELEYKDTKNLLNILKKEYYEFFELHFNDQFDFIREDLIYNLDLNEKLFNELFKTLGYHDSEFYFKYELEQYEYDKEYTIKENVEDMIDPICFYGFNTYLIISNNEKIFNHKIFDNNKLDNSKDYENLKNEVKKELFNRLINLKKEIKFKNDNLNKIQMLINNEKLKESEEFKKIIKENKIIEVSIIEYEKVLNSEILDLNYAVTEILDFNF
jgi:hypothetical protein